MRNSIAGTEQLRRRRAGGRARDNRTGKAGGLRMRIEILIQFIVPLTFLAIWALTSLLNRDAQPLPPRPGRAGNGPGTGSSPHRTRRGRRQSHRRAGGTAAGIRPAPGPRRGAGLSPEALAAQACLRIVDPGTRSINPAPALRRRRRDRVHRDDPGRGASANPAGAGTLGFRPGLGRFSTHARRQSRRGAKGRSGAGNATAPAQNRGEPETYRALSNMVTQSLALQKTKPLELTPLNAPLTGLLEYPVPGHRDTGH